MKVRCKLEAGLDPHDKASRSILEKVGRAAGKVYADRVILFDKNKLLSEQNNEKTVRAVCCCEQGWLPFHALANEGASASLKS